MKTESNRRLAFLPISASSTDPCCMVCHAQPGWHSSPPDVGNYLIEVVLAKGVRLVCRDCWAADKVPPNVMKQDDPERELFCPFCSTVSTIRAYDAVEGYPNPKDLDYEIGPYCAGCLECAAFLCTIHPTPAAALDYWRDHPEAIIEE